MMAFEENSKITNAVKELVRTVYEEGYKQGKLHAQFDDQLNKVTELVKEETPQQERDRIVKRAKEDVEELITNGDNHGLNKEEGNITYNHIFYYAEFIVNKKKRRVVVLVREKGTDVIKERGIAKCAPSDCFNAHIGKAIALRRALGLEIPEEYMNVPNPTRVRVGDKVFLHNLEICLPAEKSTVSEIEKQVGRVNISIIDDSRGE